ncbi:MAG: hypothetical protein Q4G26_11910 [Paracoccus sp. (in: a-proteobacteria)]|nr:hypothetical protein [Paracoccus sp. (in: a-proteobacteria)]
MRSTALKQFQRLEAQGTWRPAPDAQLREVIVSIGEATLILSDPKSDAPLTHWSLPAVERINPATTPALYTPAAAADDDRLEVLEIDDPLMIEAISRVQGAIAARRPHPGRLRNRLMLLALLAMVLAAVIWLPQALRDHAARITPQAERARIGQAILADMMRSTGPACQDAAAAEVLARLGRRLPLPERSRMVVLRQAPRGALMLPGHLLVIDDKVISGRDGPEALAGHLLAAGLSAEQQDPLAVVMQQVGFTDVLSLLTRGALPAGSLTGFGQALLSAPPPPPDDASLLARFAQAGIPSSPYAATRAENPVPLTDADPFRTQPYPAIMSERDWVTLLEICTDHG